MKLTLNLDIAINVEMIGDKFMIYEVKSQMCINLNR